MDLVEEFLELGKQVSQLQIQMSHMHIYTYTHPGSTYKYLVVSYKRLGECSHPIAIFGYLTTPYSRKTSPATWYQTYLNRNGFLQWLLNLVFSQKHIATYARRNLKELVKIDESEPKNCGRRFWRWLHRQPWRAMLPQAKEHLASCGYVDGMLVWKCRGPFSHLSLPRPPVPRIEVVLMDQSRSDPMYLGPWHIFLPSEVFLDCT